MVPSIDLIAERHPELKKLFKEADERLIGKSTPVSIRAQVSKETETVDVLGYAYAEEKPSQRRFPSPADKGRLDQLVKTTYSLQLANRYQSSLDATPPEAYLIPTSLAWAAERLRMHGIKLQRIDDVSLLEGLKVTQEEITEVETQSFQGLKLTKLGTQPSSERPKLFGSYFVVSTRQPLGSLACYLLEPKSDESLASWRFLDGFLEVGKPYPIVRVELGQIVPKRSTCHGNDSWGTIDP